MRAIFRFGKLGRLKFVSHLDLQRYVQRALNRANLPVAFSLGFNPHPVMSFASALAMGWESVCELLDVKLASPMDANEALERMRAALPEEMPVYACRMVDDAHPSLMARLKMADYEILLKERADEIKAGAREFLFRDCVTAIRKTKSGEREIDIRPLCLSLTARGDALITRLMLTEADTLKPDVLIGALAGIAGVEPPRVGILRTELLGVNARLKHVPLMEM